MKAIWTLDGDETSWTSWAENMVYAGPSALLQEWLAGKKATLDEWALDLGCGTGRAFGPLQHAGYQVIGLDPTARALQLSQQRAIDHHLHAYAVQASAASLPFQTTSISFVLAIGVLFHLGQAELVSALQEIRRVLRSGGEAYLHFLDIADWRRSLAQEICAEGAPVPGYRAVVTCFCTAQAIQAWIEQAGLKLVSLDLRTSTTEAGQQRNWLANVCTK